MLRLTLCGFANRKCLPIDMYLTDDSGAAKLVGERRLCRQGKAQETRNMAILGDELQKNFVARAGGVPLLVQVQIIFGDDSAADLAGADIATMFAVARQFIFDYLTHIRDLISDHNVSPWNVSDHPRQAAVFRRVSKAF